VQTNSVIVVVHSDAWMHCCEQGLFAWHGCRYQDLVQIPGFEEHGMARWCHCGEHPVCHRKQGKTRCMAAEKANWQSGLGVEFQV
jgi:hypothetical protein